MLFIAFRLSRLEYITRSNLAMRRWKMDIHARKSEVSKLLLEETSNIPAKGPSEREVRTDTLSCRYNRYLQYKVRIRH